MEELELLPWDKKFRCCNVKPGDLVLMKSGHHAIVTKIKPSFLDDEAGYELPPHVEVLYCEDNSPGSCSVHRVEKIISTGAE
jgi:hypothetical protein